MGYGSQSKCACRPNTGPRPTKEPGPRFSAEGVTAETDFLAYSLEVILERAEGQTKSRFRGSGQQPAELGGQRQGARADQQPSLPFFWLQKRFPPPNLSSSGRAQAGQHRHLAPTSGFTKGLAKFFIRGVEW